MNPYKILALLILPVVLIAACGPDTIFLRPALDTPALHVQNGHSLLARGKIDAALAEFTRAKRLDESYAPAYVGLALVQGHRGDVDDGFKTLNQASGLVVTPEDANQVSQGYELLQKMQTGAPD
jgi:Flp pilus assembly protein TadD